MQQSGLVSFRMEDITGVNRARSRLGGKMSSLSSGLGPASKLELTFDSLAAVRCGVSTLEEDLGEEAFVHTPTASELDSGDESDAEEHLKPSSKPKTLKGTSDGQPLIRLDSDDDDLSFTEYAGGASESSKQPSGTPNDEIYSPVPSESHAAADDDAESSTASQTTTETQPMAAPLATGASMEDKAVGCMLGVICGDVLGAAFEGKSLDDILDQHPDGVIDFKYTRQTGFGVYTGDMGLGIGVLLGLLRIGCCNAKQCADEYCQLYQPRRGYTDDQGDIVKLLCEGADYRETATHFEAEGHSGNGGTVRVAPIGLAYRNAPNNVLHCAVRAALLCTHVHPISIDGAFIQAASVAWLCRQDHGSSGCSPAMLLAHLILLARTDDMFQRLSVLIEHLKELMNLHKGGVSDWNAYLQSPAFHDLSQTASLIASPIQATATEAVATALLVTACHWHDPEAAIVTAVHLGGCTSCIASLVGAHVGALHGWRWVPLRWFKSLENGAHGRDVIINLARQLKLRDIKECSAPPLPTMRTGSKSWFKR